MVAVRGLSAEPGQACGGGVPAEGLAWAGIEFGGELLGAGHAQVAALGEGV